MLTTISGAIKLEPHHMGFARMKFVMPAKEIEVFNQKNGTEFYTYKRRLMFDRTKSCC
ncbi:MAG: hypothetical protein JSS53_09745 [Proteobacteria bacterium]|nr:hypothetical protein [Pseudomonadota bacterium]